MYKWTAQSIEVQFDYDAEDCDVIGGIVTDVYDGNTFALMVTEEDYDNEFEYDEYELIRIFGEPAPVLNTAEGREAAEELFTELDGEQVVLYVYGRDKQGYLIAHYELID